MSQPLNILQEAASAIALAQADFVLAETLTGTMGFQHKKKVIDDLMALRNRIEQSALAIGREIYPIDEAITRPKQKLEQRKKYQAGAVIYEGKKIAHGLNDAPKSIHDEN